MAEALRQVRIRAIAWDAEGVLTFTLADAAGLALAPYDPGAHLELHLAGGLSRSYSLLEPYTDGGVYRIGVAFESLSRGGSRHLHERARPGDLLHVAAPRNHFALERRAANTVLIGGGIGVTPLLCMAQALALQGSPFALHYAARERRTAAFLDRVAALGSAAQTYFTRDGDARPDLCALVAAAPAGTHFYCCGPAAMLERFAEATAHLPASFVHVEHFAAIAEKAVDGGFTIELAASGRTLLVPPGKSILDCVLAAGIDAPHSCLEGVCGQCETRVRAGVPDHRDAILSAEEQASGTTMMICCSGAKTPRLVLDL